jgi:hypothetical protein
VHLGTCAGWLVFLLGGGLVTGLVELSSYILLFWCIYCSVTGDRYSFEHESDLLAKVAPLDPRTGSWSFTAQIDPPSS